MHAQTTKITNFVLPNEVVEQVMHEIEKCREKHAWEESHPSKSLERANFSLRSRNKLAATPFSFKTQQVSKASKMEKVSPKPPYIPHYKTMTPQEFDDYIAQFSEQIEAI